MKFHFQQPQFLIFALTIFSTTHSFAVQTRKTIFQNISLQQGLSVSTIHDIYQDREGYIWFATAYGANRYDGYDFRIHKKEVNDSTSIGDHRTQVIFEDSRGNLWFGTASGVLAQYNRKTGGFTNYTIDPPALQTQNMDIVPTAYPVTYAFYSPHTITDIKEDMHGNLWLATWGSGIAVFHPHKKEFIYVQAKKDEPASPSANRISSLLYDEKKNMWVGTFGSGLNRYNSEIDIFNEYKSNPSTNENNASFSHYRHAPLNNTSLSDDRVSMLFLDSQHNMWIGTFFGGLNLLNTFETMDSTTFYRPVLFSHFKHDKLDNTSLSNNNILSMCEDKNGALWIGTYGGGLNKLDSQTGRFTVFKNDPNDPNSLSENNITSIFEDHSGILWIGTLLGKGIDKLVPDLQKFIHYKKMEGKEQSLNDNIVFALGEDKQSSGRYVWVGTLNGGLNKFDRLTEKVEHYTHKTNDKYSISHDHIRSVYCDAFGYLWVGTFSEGLNRTLEPTTRFPELLNTEVTAKNGVQNSKPQSHLQFKNYLHDPTDENSLSFNQIRTLYEMPDSTLWICTFGGGLNKYNRAADNFTHYKFNPEDENSLPDDHVYSVCGDKTGLLWIGTFGGGIASLDLKSGEIKRFQYDAMTPGSLSDNRVLTVYVDAFGILWVGTDGGGLNRFDREAQRFTIFSEEEGLTNKTIYGILEDEEHNLWLSSNNGVYKYKRAENKFKAYEVSHGLQGREYSGGAALKISDGTMFFGGVHGFNEFHPRDIHENPHVPPIVITRFTKYNNPSPFDPQQINLSYEENFFTIHFAALDYTNPAANKYMYKLEGMNDQWINVDSDHRFASYTNLDPGHYSFRVKGSNNDGLWNEVGTSIDVVITPPFYREMWFYFSVTFSFIAAIVFFHKYRIKQKVRRQIELDRIRNLENERVRKQVAEDFHDEFGHKLSGITLYIELIKRGMLNNPKQVSPYLDTMAEISRNLSSGMRNFIWTLDPEVDSFYDFAVHMKDYADHYFNKKEIAFWVEGIDEAMKSVRLPMQYRRQFTYIFKEALSNLQKYVNCNNVTLSFQLHDLDYRIQLKTDGAVTGTRAEFYENPERMMQKRSQKIAAALQTSLEDSGLRIELTGTISYGEFEARTPL